jgi:hypothetical protein
MILKSRCQQAHETTSTSGSLRCLHPATAAFLHNPALLALLSLDLLLDLPLSASLANDPGACPF